MSTMKVINVQHPSASTPNIVNDSSGNVGIGTSSPQGKLDVALSTGRVIFQTSSGVNYITSLNSTLTGSQDFQINGNILQFLTQGAEAGRFDTNKNFYFNSGYGSTAVAYGCRAWANFDGTATPPTIRASGNISSVARPATGYYTMNFTNSFPDTSYSTVSFCRDDAVQVMFTATNTIYAKSTSSFTFYTVRTNGTQSNSADVSFAAFR